MSEDQSSAREQVVRDNPIVRAFERFDAAGEHRPVILGGAFDAARLDDFLKLWQVRLLQMPWRLWEHISTIEFADAPAEPEYLRRADIFGPGGHLTLRRTGASWSWHYVGPPQPPSDTTVVASGAWQDFWRTTTQAHSELAAMFEGHDFWVSPDATQVRLRRYAERFILWGKGSAEHPTWREDRVAAANLRYPHVPAGKERVYLHLWRYTDAGRTVFVQYRELTADAEQEANDD